MILCFFFVFKGFQSFSLDKQSTDNLLPLHLMLLEVFLQIQETDDNVGQVEF